MIDKKAFIFSLLFTIISFVILIYIEYTWNEICKNTDEKVIQKQIEDYRNKIQNDKLKIHTFTNEKNSVIVFENRKIILQEIYDEDNKFVASSYYYKTKEKYDIVEDVISLCIVLGIIYYYVLYKLSEFFYKNKTTRK